MSPCLSLGSEEKCILSVAAVYKEPFMREVTYVWWLILLSATWHQEKEKQLDLEPKKNLQTGKCSMSYSSASRRLLRTISHAGCYARYHALAATHDITRWLLRTISRAGCYAWYHALAATHDITRWLLRTISHAETLLNVLNFKSLSHIVFV